MKQSEKFILLFIGFAVLILFAGIGYQYLTTQYNISTPEMTKATDQTNTAADFTVIDANDNSITLSDYFGKPIIINFWATWCGPCKMELPAFDAAYQEYGDQITFLMVNLTDGYRDTISGVKDFVEQNAYSFPVYFDTQYEASTAYRASSIPLTIIIDSNGNVSQSHIGAMKEETLKQYIELLLEDTAKSEE